MWNIKAITFRKLNTFFHIPENKGQKKMEK